MTATNGNAYLAEALKAYGLTHVFMVPTVAVPALAHLDRIGVSGITTHGEKAAAYMADGYARARGGPGVCLAQTIGAANLAAGLRDPFMAGSPVIAITGGTRPLSRYRHVYQEIEDFPLYETVTKLNAHVDDVRRLPDMLRQAFREAVSGGPGPVHLEIQGLAAEILGAELEVDAATGPLAEEAFAFAPPFRPAADDGGHPPGPGAAGRRRATGDRRGRRGAVLAGQRRAERAGPPARPSGRHLAQRQGHDRRDGPPRRRRRRQLLPGQRQPHRRTRPTWSSSSAAIPAARSPTTGGSPSPAPR